MTTKNLWWRVQFVNSKIRSAPITRVTNYKIDLLVGCRILLFSLFIAFEESLVDWSKSYTILSPVVAITFSKHLDRIFIYWWWMELEKSNLFIYEIFYLLLTYTKINTIGFKSHWLHIITHDNHPLAPWTQYTLNCISKDCPICS